MKRFAPVFVIKQQINAQARLQFLIKRPALVFVISLAHSATLTLIQEAVPIATLIQEAVPIVTLIQEAVLIAMLIREAVPIAIILQVK